MVDASGGRIGYAIYVKGTKPQETRRTGWMRAEAVVLVIDETRFLKQGKASCGGGASVYGVSGQAHQFPDRRVRGLCLAERSCFHRAERAIEDTLVEIWAYGRDRAYKHPEEIR